MSSSEIAELSLLPRPDKAVGEIVDEALNDTQGEAALREAPPDDAARLLFELVSIPSISRDEQHAVSFLTRSLARFGLDAEIDDAGNAVGRLGLARGDADPEVPGGGLEVMLLGHIDTVPGGPAASIRDGTLYGRGAVDAKGPLAVFAAVAARLARRPEEGLRLTVVGAVEEEISSSKGARFIAQNHRPDFCVIGEPSSATAVTLGYKGRLLVDIVRRRPTAHSAGPEPTATQEIVAAWGRVEKLAFELNRELNEKLNQGSNPGRPGVFRELQTELQSIHTSRRRSGDPGANADGHVDVDMDVDHCRATFGFRLPPALSPDALKARLMPLLDDFEVHFRGGEPAWVGERSSRLAHAFTGAIRDVASVRPRLKNKTGTSDMNVVGPVWRCPILAYGPGDSRLDHTPQEHVLIAEVRLAVAILESALRRLAKT